MFCFSRRRLEEEEEEEKKDRGGAMRRKEKWAIPVSRPGLSVVRIAEVARREGGREEREGCE